MARTVETLAVLINSLQSNCGDMYAACRAANVSLMFVRAWCKDDTTVAEQLDEAARVGAMQLESEAIRRAVYGDEKGVYFKGERVGEEYVKSDGLLQTLLKGRMRHVYGSDVEGQSGGITVNGQAVINVMPRADNYEDWLRMKDATDVAIKRRDHLEALPAPEQVIEATCTPVSEEAQAAYTLMAPTSPFEGLGI